ncbi:hypothetical protein GHT06_016555 [Daphnia sinensis]|uniref:Uncharacterized protein n=1 Tax=Daphnia sinensis TaxID=1820382 RepID=A0AAD5KPK7_9CRUS|nr:hypothetical protein GHT06_016555 [Daphnia sinensis]
MLQWFILLNFFIEFGNGQIPPGCEVTTTTGYRYSQFHHLHSSPDGIMELRFRVMARSDAHIVLTTSPLVLNPLYEIVIGASGNNYTDLRRTMTGRSVSAVKTPSLLSDSEFRGFWVLVRRGEIEIGREGETLPYFHWKDPDPLPVHYYSLSSWTSTVAKWIQNCNFGGKTSWLTPPDNSSSQDTGAAIPPQSVESYYNAEEKLKANLLSAYNKDVRPSSYHRTPVSVFLGLGLFHFDLSEIMSSFEIHAAFRMAWRDERLQWNASAYENVTVLHFPSHAIWQPDLKLYNSISAADIIHLGEGALVMVYPDGGVLLAPSTTSFSSQCHLDLRMWPWDRQTCTLMIGSWTQSGWGIDLKLYDNYDEIGGIVEYALNTKDLFTTNLQWELLSSNASMKFHSYGECSETHGCPDDQYPVAYFTFVIQRRSPLYRATVTVPAIMITILTLVAFILPPNSTEKVLIGLVDLLILSVFLVYFSSLLPPMGDHMPHIVTYLSNTLILVALSLVLAVVTMTMVRTPRMHGPPGWVKRIITGLPGKLLGLGHIITLVNHVSSNRGSQQQGMDDYTLHVDSGEHDVNLVNTSVDRRVPVSHFRGATKDMNPAELEWLLLAYGLDRLAFMLYILFFFIMMAMCF